MILIGIALMIMILSVQCFTVTYRINGINRTLLETPTSLFEVSIPIVQDNGEFVPYFDKEKLIKKLTYYYDSKLPEYTSDYQVSYYYTNVGSSSLCLLPRCDAIEITIRAKIIFLSEYNKTMRFEIRRAS